VAMIATAMLAATVAPAMAGAQVTSPSCEQYSSSTGQFGGGGGGGNNGPVVGGGGEQCNTVDPGGGGGSTTPPSGLNSRVGGLPFTGFDVLSMAAVALAVTGLGLVLQRAVSRPREEL
jgi:hypothetical protein